MKAEISDDFKKRTAETAAMTKDPRSWMSKQDEKLFSDSGKKTPAAWIESLGVSVAFWIETKRNTQKILESSPVIRPKLTPLPTINDIKKRKERNKKEDREFKLLREYTTITPTGRRITITKLSRPFTGDEEDLHRCRMCDDEDVRECIDFAIKMKINTFSCVHCQFFELVLT